MSTRKAIVLLAPWALMAACTTPGTYAEPYALVESGSRSPVRKELPATVNAVDGQTTFIPRRYPTLLKPGKHVIDVYFSTDVGPPSKQYRTIELDAAACTRYRIVARYIDLTHVEWTPVIYPEPIGECNARFAPKS
jgi:hypothetical protein